MEIDDDENYSPRSLSKGKRRDESDSDDENFFDEELYKRALDAAKVE